MGSIYLRKYGVGTTLDFSLYKLDGTGLKVDAVSASGDINLYRDEAPSEQLDADAFVDEGQIYSLVLSAAEMNAARIIVCIVDQTGPQVWLDKSLIVETYGNASSQHAFDLDTATQPVNLTEIGGVAQSAADLKNFADVCYNPATNSVTKVDTSASVTLCDQTTLVDGVTLCDQTTLVDGVTLCDQTTLVDGVTLCDRTTLVDGVTLCDRTTLVDTTTTNSDLVTAAVIADAVLDEIIDVNAPANANSLRETINVIVAAVAGKLSGGGGANRVFRDLGDTKDRITVVVDANYNRTASTPDGT